MAYHGAILQICGPLLFMKRSSGNNGHGAARPTAMLAKENIVERLLSSRLSDLGVLLKRLLGLNSIPEEKFSPALPSQEDARALRKIVFSIRGENYSPAIIIHGVMPRSGTNYLSSLLQFHDDISHHPHRLWEFPLLTVADGCQYLQRDFIRTYRRNAEVLKEYEFAAVLAAGFMRHLQQLTGPGKTMLLKSPHVEFIELFRILFPRDYLVLVLRDGRDVVASSLRTFTKGLLRKGFQDYCREWHYGAEAILRLDRNNDPRTLILRYEDMFADPVSNIRRVLEMTGLGESGFHFDKLDTMKVIGSSELSEGGRVDWHPRQRPATFKPVGRWHDWSNRRKRQFRTIAGKALIESGYEKDSNW